jgi:hypothetical protein
MAAQISSWQTRRRSKRDRRRTLHSAFRAEVNTIRGMVRIEVKDIVRRLESGRSLTGSKWGAVVIPTLVYSENVNTLGELDDQTLVQNLVWMYSHIVPAFEFDRGLREAQASLKRYW